MLLLAIESSCDETSVAIARGDEILATRVASQISLHAEYGGVVPELATRQHLRNLLPVARLALQDARIQPRDLDAVAATQGPGLPNALMTGLRAAQGLAFSLGKPFFGIHHHEAHLYSPWIVGSPPRTEWGAFEPSVSLIVSGGHTLLVDVPRLLDHRVLGGTIDDAAGECFDKTGKLMGLPYPAGPEMDQLARGANPNAHPFPRPMIDEPGDTFSFSGLKTSVRYFLQANPSVLQNEASRRDVCASVQEAIVEVLVAKTVKATLRLGRPCMTGSGGVICNRRLRERLASAAAEHGLRLRLAEPRHCTDNAAMVAALAGLKYLRGAAPTPLDSGIEPGWAL